jgi:hypothetical protein
MAVGSQVGDKGEAMHRRQIMVRCISVTWLITWGVGGQNYHGHYAHSEL